MIAPSIRTNGRTRVEVFPIYVKAPRAEYVCTT
ncbi:hypothetical protein J2857_004937 [Neorhizobium galegae]|nr:hypothetical protein [Neorhizobium galegae]